MPRSNGAHWNALTLLPGGSSSSDCAGETALLTQDPGTQAGWRREISRPVTRRGLHRRPDSSVQTLTERGQRMTLEADAA